MSYWKDISSAPKDGTRVLVGCFRVAENFGKFLGYMTVDQWDDGFRGFGKFNDHYWPATHWMHLPDPPSSAEEIKRKQEETTIKLRKEGISL